MQRIEALVKPELLVWARKSLKIPINEIAKKVHKDIALWEKGEKKPTVPQLRKLANIYKRPLAVFYLPAPPAEETLPPDFRSIPTRQDFPFTKKTYLTIRRARRIQKIAKNLAADLGQKNRFPFAKTNITKSPEMLAKEARDKLGISVETQSSWDNKRTALREWKYAVENIGVIVLEMSHPIEESRGLALYDEEFPVIVINPKDFPAARIFSIFHELCHLILNVSGISDLKETGFMDKNIQRQEIFCNHFSGAFLVPAENLEKSVSSKFSSEWPDETLKQLSNQFNVSQEVILRRLLILGLTNRKFYKRKREEFKKIESQLREKSEGGRKEPARDCIRDNGHKFINLVYENFYEGSITYRDIADYLKISPKYLPELEQRFFGNIR